MAEDCPLCLGGKIAPSSLTHDAGRRVRCQWTSLAEHGRPIDVYRTKVSVTEGDDYWHRKPAAALMKLTGHIPRLSGVSMTTKRAARCTTHRIRQIARSREAQEMVGRTCGIENIRPGAYRRKWLDDPDGGVRISALT